MGGGFFRYLPWGMGEANVGFAMTRMRRFWEPHQYFAMKKNLYRILHDRTYFSIETSYLFAHGKVQNVGGETQVRVNGINHADNIYDSNVCEYQCPIFRE